MPCSTVPRSAGQAGDSYALPTDESVGPWLVDLVGDSSPVLFFPIGWPRRAIRRVDPTDHRMEPRSSLVVLLVYLLGTVMVKEGQGPTKQTSPWVGKDRDPRTRVKPCR